MQKADHQFKKLKATLDETKRSWTWIKKHQ